MTPALTYWSSGGDIVATHGHVITLEEARRLCCYYLKEAAASARLGDRQTGDSALRLAGELGGALNASARWRRAAQPLDYASAGRIMRAANSSRELTLGMAASGMGTPRKRHKGSHPSDAS
jgi:hypothetical protein